MLPDPMCPSPYRILRRRRENHDSFTLELAPADGSPHPGFTPGQFNMLYHFGVGEVPISFSGAPHDATRMIHTIRAVGPVTKAIEKLKVGDTLGVRGPFGVGWPVQEARRSDLLLVAGGIGLAPLRPVIYAVLAQRAQLGRLVVLYGARSPQELLFVRELERWRTNADLEIEVIVDRADDRWDGQVGVVPSLIARARCDVRHTIALLCGPEIMMRYGIRALLSRGVPAHQIFLSMERNMKCAVGLCGRCQWGPTFMCKDGPVFCYDSIRSLFDKQEL